MDELTERAVLVVFASAALGAYVLSLTFPNHPDVCALLAMAGAFCVPALLMSDTPTLRTRGVPKTKGEEEREDFSCNSGTIFGLMMSIAAARIMSAPMAAMLGTFSAFVVTGLVNQNDD